MDKVLDEVKKLDCTELRNKLKELGDPVGPITGTTKILFQKRLAKRLYESSIGDTAIGEEQNFPKSATEESKVDEARDDKSIQHPKPSQYFAVCLSPDDLSKAQDEDLVLTAKEDLHNLLKKYPGSRFKAFKTEQEAKEYIKQDPSQWTKRNQSSDQLLVAGEKSEFRGPKPQELMQLRLAIEAGNLEDVRETVWSNPRFLVSSGDTPTILHEGLHYNALHVAAKENKPAICHFLLATLADPRFTGRLYANSKDTETTRQKRINFLLDLYLNLPDKGSCESPLHLACKFGHKEVVRELMAFSGVDCNLKNKYGETPADVVCSRRHASEQEKQEIRELLEGLCFVPLLRAEDNSTAPVIGQPSSPDLGLEPWSSDTSSPRNAKLVVKACAGPMSPSRAKQFQRKWATPPPSPQKEQMRLATIRREDFEKGMERIGRELAGEMRVPWREYWEFLDSFVDLSTEDGLQQLENYLARIQTVAVTNSLLQASPHLASTPTSSLLPPPSSPNKAPSLPFSPLCRSADSLPVARSLWQTGPSAKPPVPHPPGSPGSSSDEESGPESAPSLAPWLSSPSTGQPSSQQLQREFSHLKEELDKFKEKYHITSTPVKGRGLKGKCKGRQDQEEKNASGGKCSPKINLLTRIERDCPDRASGNDKEVLEASALSNKDLLQELEVATRKLKEVLPSNGITEEKGQTSDGSVGEQMNCPVQECACEESGCVGGQPQANQQSSHQEAWKMTRSQLSDSNDFSAEGNLNLSVLSLEEAVPTQHSRNSTMSELCSQFNEKLYITPVVLEEDHPVCPKVDEMSRFTLKVTVPLSALENGKPTSVALMLQEDVERAEEGDWFHLWCHACFLRESLSPEELLQSTVLECQLGSQDRDSLLSLVQLKTVFVTGVCVVASPPEAVQSLPTCMPAYIFSKALRDRQMRRHFILGERASKLDLDVYRAVPKSVDPQRFPAIHAWQSQVSALAQEGEKSSFPSPARLLQDSRSQHSRVSTPLSFRSLGSQPLILPESPLSLSWHSQGDQHH